MKYGFEEREPNVFVRKEGLCVVWGERLVNVDKTAILQVWKESEEYHLFAQSTISKMRALEFVDYILGDMGVCRGSAQEAQGKLSISILKIQMEELEIVEPLDYFLHRSAAYFEECQEVWAENFAKQENIAETMGIYQKKKIPWAYVKSTDIAGVGERIKLKTLENESGIELEASDALYIMVGERGEVYHIARETFEKTYDAKEKKFDVFKQMVEFLPEVEVGKGQYVSLDNLANLCYPKSGKHIYAKQLQQRTRVYPKGAYGQYFLGQVGDYLVVREDNHQDVYIVQQDVFRETYEEV